MEEHKNLPESQEPDIQQDALHIDGGSQADVASVPDTQPERPVQQDAGSASEKRRDTAPVIIEESTIFNAPQPEDAPKRRKKSGYGKLIGLLTGGCLVLALAITLVVVFWAVPESDVADPTETEAIALISLEASNVRELAVQNAAGEFTMTAYQTTEDTDEDGTEETVTKLKLKDYDDIPQDADVNTLVLTNFCALEAVSQLSGDWTEESCGLLKPAVTASATLQDGETVTCSLGNQSPDGSGYYCKVSGKEDIYIVATDIFTSFSQTIEDFVDTQIIEKMEAGSDSDIYFSGGELARYDEIRLSGSKYPAPITFDYDSTSEVLLRYRITSPINRYANDDRITMLLAPFTSGLDSSGVYKLRYSEADLQEYGLDQPGQVVYYKIKDQEFTLRVSRLSVKDNGYYACTINDVPVIYKLSQDVCAFLDYSLDDFRSENLFISQPQYVDTFSVTLDGQTTVYHISTEEQTDEDGNETTNIVVTLDGERLDTASFQNMYAGIALVRAADYLEDPPAVTGEPYLTLHLTFNNGWDDQTLQFIKYNDRYYRYLENGAGDELINYMVVDQLVESIRDFQAGETVLSPA